MDKMLNRCCTPHQCVNTNALSGGSCFTAKCGLMFIIKSSVSLGKCQLCYLSTAPYTTALSITHSMFKLRMHFEKDRFICCPTKLRPKKQNLEELQNSTKHCIYKRVKGYNMHLNMGSIILASLTAQVSIPHSTKLMTKIFQSYR